MAAPQEILDLIARFERHHESYESAAYNETQLRREFLDPFFEALGWDVQNKEGAAEAYKDVIHEDAIKVGAFTKAPDYGFRIGGTRKFFVEAKKPAKKLKDDAEAAFQLRRYAWSATLPLSILTDFQEFAVYDTRFRPSPKDKASVGRVLYFTYAEYAEKWDEIAAIFSLDAVRQGAFDKFAQAKRPKRGALPVDKAFLNEIEGWREGLAKNFAARDPKLDVREINFAVQRIIDRIIFLRIAEDRGIEPYGRLQVLLNGKNVYARLLELFEQADGRYNSGLFYFKEEKGRAERPDELTPGLKVDDEVLQNVIEDLYPPKSPYAFSVISADILGAVYEQFLGKVIRLTAGHHVKVEEKPEVRKAGGVYYTPTYIVEYIVKQTVGKLLEGKTPKQAGELKVLDPACGSGSFLIGAYQHLLDWHRDWYVKDGVEKHRKVLYQGMGGEWRLTTKERTRILLNNIYGVDIDQQAVEVTKLSLLLKVLEGGSPDALQREFWGAHERVLPDLGSSIKCGNSVIGPDFYEHGQLAMFDQEEKYRINAFEWQAEFKDIMASGGFDAVIGNPPYLSYSGRQAIEISAEERDYFASHYAWEGWVTSHGLFIERSVRDLSARLVSLIVPDQVGHLDGYKAVREAVTRHSRLGEVRYWGEKVFRGVVTPALTFVADKTHSGEARVIAGRGQVHLRAIHDGEPWMVTALGGLLPKLRKRSVSLGDLVADPGVHTGNSADKLILDVRPDGKNLVPVLEGKQVSRYSCDVPTKSLDLGYRARQGEYFTIRPRERYTAASFVIRQTAAYPIVGPREHADYFRNSLLALYSPVNGMDVRYVVGLLNSRLIRLIYSQTVQESQQKAFPQVKVRSLRDLPIRDVDLSSNVDRRRHDEMVDLVRQMLDLHKRLSAAKTPIDDEQIKRQIGVLDHKIDRLVFDLYELSDEETRLVEEPSL